MKPTASNPAKLPFNPLCYWRYNPNNAAIAFGFAIVVIATWGILVWTGHKASIPTKDGGETPIYWFAFGALATLGFYTYLKSRKFKTGDANPGVIVSLDPTLLAVHTDLAKDEIEFPAIKIVRTRITSVNGKPFKVGTCIPTVSQYLDSAGRDAMHWGDFEPEPAAYATSDEDSINRLASTFGKDQFDLLSKSLKQIPRPFEPGLYALWHTPGKAQCRRITSKSDF